MDPAEETPESAKDDENDNVTVTDMEQPSQSIHGDETLYSMSHSILTPSNLDAELVSGGERSATPYLYTSSNESLSGLVEDISPRSFDSGIDKDESRLSVADNDRADIEGFLSLVEAFKQDLSIDVFYDSPYDVRRNESLASQNPGVVPISKVVNAPISRVIDISKVRRLARNIKNMAAIIEEIDKAKGPDNISLAESDGFSIAGSENEGDEVSLEEICGISFEGHVLAEKNGSDGPNPTDGNADLANKNQISINNNASDKGHDNTDFMQSNEKCLMAEPASNAKDTITVDTDLLEDDTSKKNNRNQVVSKDISEECDVAIICNPTDEKETASTNGVDSSMVHDTTDGVGDN